VDRRREREGKVDGGMNRGDGRGRGRSRMDENGYRMKKVVS
jgi:hypothetical protein